jgi:predicted HTH domain antitoxin
MGYWRNSMPITLHLPEDVEKHLQAQWPDLERHALEALVVEAYRQKQISANTAGRILGLHDRWDVIEFLSSRGVYPNYDAEELAEDRRTLQALETRPNS